MRYPKTLVLASLLALAASAAVAAPLRGGISTGLSGSSAGMISEGGKAAFNLDVKPAPTAEAQREAKEARESRSERRRGADAYASTDGDSHIKTKPKKKKASTRGWGFTSFGYSGAATARYRHFTDN